MNNIEKEIFERSRLDYNKLLNYGFIEQDDNYILEKDLDDTFKVIIEFFDFLELLLFLDFLILRIFCFYLWIFLCYEKRHFVLFH